MRLFVLIALLLMSSLTVFAVRAADVVMQESIPYAEDADVAKKIRTECVELQKQLAQFTKEFAAENGVTVELGDIANASGRVLKVEISEAVSRGNAFIGHRKYTEIRGELSDNGKKIASFKGLRESMGGAFAGYKGSCSVLGRTVKALGKDIGMWLAKPEDGAELGDY